MPPAEEVTLRTNAELREPGKPVWKSVHTLPGIGPVKRCSTRRKRHDIQKPDA